MKGFLLACIVLCVCAHFAAAGPAAKIAEATKKYWGHSTRDGPDGGNLACAWAVNNILSNAGLRKIGTNPNYVPSVVQGLKAGRGHLISAHDAVPGDLAVACGEHHIGVCMSTGCGTIDSNSASKACFCWEASYSSFTSYYGCQPAIYRVDN